jgi:hypothetical protein
MAKLPRHARVVCRVVSSVHCSKFRPHLELSSGPKTCPLRQTKDVYHLYISQPRAGTRPFQVVRVVVTRGPNLPRMLLLLLLMLLLLHATSANCRFIDAGAQTAVA